MSCSSVHVRIAATFRSDIPGSAPTPTWEPIPQPPSNASITSVDQLVIPFDSDEAVFRDMPLHQASSSRLLRLLATWQLAGTSGTADLSNDLRFDQATAILHSMAGYSDVYQTTLDHPSGKLKVAIKALRSVHMSDVNNSGDNSQERVARRMLREMRVWKCAKHPRIVPLLGYAILDMGPCLISPWCANGNVLEYLQSHPDADRFTLISHVAEGLAFLHSSTPIIVHSDLKGNNVLISDSGEAMLCDFGLSKLLEDVPSGLTTSNTSAGTLRWMAPELLTVKRSTTQSDIYSYGCLALEIMTGRLPFEKHRSDVVLMRAKMTGEEIIPADYPELDQRDPLWSLLRRCWSRDPTLRPSADEVLAELRFLQC